MIVVGFRIQALRSGFERAAFGAAGQFHVFACKKFFNCKDLDFVNMIIHIITLPLCLSLHSIG